MSKARSVEFMQMHEKHVKFILFLFSIKALEVLLFAFPASKYSDFSVSIVGHKINQLGVKPI